MAKPYEIHGIPENAWLEFDEPPYYAVIYETKVKDTFDRPHGLMPGDLRLWGQADYWTPLEAALLLAGVSPDDYELYAVEKEMSANDDFVENGEYYYCWKYAYKFDSARDYLFLFERSSLAPKAPPIEWVKYFNKKVRDVSVRPPFEPNYVDDWLGFFADELNEPNHVENVPPSSEGISSRREQQHEIIMAVIAAMEFDPLNIPDGGKAKIKKACVTRPKVFTEASFDHAWKAGVSAGLFRLANHEKFSPG